MVDLLRVGSDWLATMRKAYAADAVTYCRASATVIVQATAGKTDFEVETTVGVERVESRDYLIAAADLVLDGETVLPERGDLVKELIGSAVAVYEVLAPGAEPVWRYSDAGHKTLRIHTKFVDTE